MPPWIRAFPRGAPKRSVTFVQALRGMVNRPAWDSAGTLGGVTGLVAPSPDSAISGDVLAFAGVVDCFAAAPWATVLTAAGDFVDVAALDVPCSVCAATSVSPRSAIAAASSATEERER